MDFIITLLKEYPMFKANHFKKTEKNSITNMSKINNPYSNSNQNVSIYTIRDKIYKIIPSEYFEENFKIKKEYLCLGRMEIEMLNRDVYSFILKIKKFLIL